MTAAVALLAAVSFWVSYQHCISLALRLGEDPVTARLVPITVDVTLIAAALVGLFCSRYGTQRPPLASFALVLGVLATIVVNVAEGLDRGPWAAVFAGWPAVTLVVAAEMLLWLIAETRVLDARQVVLIDRSDGQKPDNLSAAVTMLANEPSISGAEMGRRLGLPYGDALRVMKQAQGLLGQSR